MIGFCRGREIEETFADEDENFNPDSFVSENQGNPFAGFYRHMEFFRYKDDVSHEQKLQIIGNFSALRLRCTWPTNGIYYVQSIDAGFTNSHQMEHGFVVSFTSVWDRHYFVGDDSTDCIAQPHDCDPHFYLFKKQIKPLLYDGPEPATYQFDFEVLA